MSKFNVGDKVVSKGYPHLGEEVGVVAGIDLGGEVGDGKYLVKFNSLDICSGWGYGCFRDDCDCIIEPYEGYAEWVDEDDLVKVEEECEDKYEKEECEEECEENIRTKFESVRKQKEEIIKEKSKKVLELTLEIKEIEHEIEKIKKEWHL